MNWFEATFDENLLFESTDKFSSTGISGSSESARAKGHHMNKFMISVVLKLVV